MRTLSLLLLFSIGLAPTAVMGLLAFSLFGKTAPCDLSACNGKTYGAELLVLPASTLAPFVCGMAVATIATRKKKYPSRFQPPVPAKERSRHENPA